MRTTRLMTRGMAAAAVASAITFTAVPATAVTTDDRPCGQPAVPEVTRWVTIEPVYETLPPVTHEEWLWERDRDVIELEFLRVLAEARSETDWTREVPGPVLQRWTRVVVDEPAVPAVPAVPPTGHLETYEISPAVYGTEAEYRHQTTGNLRWERDDWGAQNGQGQGWVKTGETRQVLVTAAVTGTRWVEDSPGIPGTPEIPAKTHVEELWSATDPGAPWTGPSGSMPGPTSTETTTTDGSTPAGDGWAAVATRTIPADTETGWAESLPAGTTATGSTRVARTEHDVTDTPSAEAPAGDGWTKVADSARTVVDQEAEQVLVTPGSTYLEVVTPALPATEPCVEPPVAPGTGTDDGTGGGSDDGTDDGTGAGTDAGTDDGAQPAAPQVQGPQAGPAAASPAGAVSPAATGLPDTGGVPSWMLPAGLATVLAGAVVARTGRRSIRG